MHRSRWFVFSLLALVAPGGCLGDDEADAANDEINTGSAGLTWFATCGDPVCRGEQNPPPDDLCGDGQTEGEVCRKRDASCALNDGCGGRLVCSDADPKPPSCPISQRAAKRGISYLNDADLLRLANDLDALRLATYHYREEPASAPSRLGFVIEDVPNPSYAVRPRRDRVDLYGYATMAVAALKVQSKRLAELENRLEQLERTCSAKR